MAALTTLPFTAELPAACKRCRAQAMHTICNTVTAHAGETHAGASNIHTCKKQEMT